MNFSILYVKLAASLLGLNSFDYPESINNTPTNYTNSIKKIKIDFYLLFCEGVNSLAKLLEYASEKWKPSFTRRLAVSYTSPRTVLPAATNDYQRPLRRELDSLENISAEL